MPVVAAVGPQVGGGGDAEVVVGTTIITGGTSGRVLYDNAGVVGEYPITGTAGSVVMSESPTVTTSLIATVTPTTGNGVAISGATVTSGNLVSIAASGTAAAGNTKTALNVATSGANGTNAMTTYGAQISNTSTNATSGTNIGLKVVASGATTANTGIVVDGSPSITASSGSLTLGDGGIPVILNGFVGTSTSSGFLVSASSYGFGWSNGGAALSPDTTLSRQGAGVVQFGTTTANALGSILAVGATFSGALINSGITSDGGHTDSTVCQDTTTHQFYAGSGAAGICLGTSSARFKESISDVKEGLAEILKLRPRTFRYKKGIVDSGARMQYGLVAEEVERVIPSIVAKGRKGEINSVDYGTLFPLLIKAVQELTDRYDAQIELLNTRLNTLMA